MKKWKRNAIIVTILLFVCVAVYLNVAPGKANKAANADEAMDAQSAAAEDARETEAPETADTSAPEAAQTVGTYFEAARLERRESRDAALTLLEEAAAYEGADGASVAEQIQTIADRALTEAQIELLVEAKGFNDCVAVVSDSGVSVMVPSVDEGLTEEQVARITEIVVSEASVPAAKLEIIEVK